MLFCRGLLQKILNIIRLGRQRVRQLDQLRDKAAAAVDRDPRRAEQRLLLRQTDREREGHVCAGILLRLQQDRAAVRLDHRLHDGQAEARAGARIALLLRLRIAGKGAG